MALLPCAASQTYPVKPIRMIVTFPAGSGADIVARTVGQKMAESLGQQVVDRQSGGCRRHRGVGSDGQSIPGRLHDRHGLVGAYDQREHVQQAPVRSGTDFAPITMLASTPYLLVAHPSVPAKNVAELIALAKARPGQINYASGGVGVARTLPASLFKNMAGVDIVNVPYKGAPQATADVVGGQVQLSLSTMPTALPLVRAGKLTGWRLPA